VVVYTHHVVPKVDGGEGQTVELCGPCHDEIHGIPYRLDIATLTRRGLAAAKARGVKLGPPVLNTELQERATELRRQGQTFQAIADAFNAEGHRTAKGAEYKAMTVRRMVERVDPAANPVGGYK